jgi:hypothetical protein
MALHLRCHTLSLTLFDPVDRILTVVLRVDAESFELRRMVWNPILRKRSKGGGTEPSILFQNALSALLDSSFKRAA